MKILTGDEFGLLKLVDVNKKMVISKYGEMKKSNGVVGIDNLFDSDNNTLGVAHERNFYILNWNECLSKSQPELNLENNTHITSQIIKRTIDFSSVILCRSDNKLSVLQYDDEINLKSNQEIPIKTNKLQVIKNSVNTNEIFCLFKDSPLCIFNLEKNQVSWKAKNLPNDELDLVVPMWDTDVVTSQKNNLLIYTSTAFGEIRTYDRKMKAVPVNNKKVCDRRINKMVQSNCDNYLTIGDSIGNISLLDKRKSIKFLIVDMVVAKTLKGSTGAIRDIVHLNGGLTLSCGLDRFLRVYDYKTYEDLPQVFMKNKLNVLFPFEVEAKEESVEGEAEEDEFMDECEELEDDEDISNHDDDSISKKEDSDNNEEYEDFEEIEDDIQKDEESFKKHTRKQKK
jgi:ribosome biogenesis protein NSA1